MFKWCKQSGYATPNNTEAFDRLLSEWAECLWAEGGPRSILGNGLSGLTHFVPSLKRKLNGAWRLYNAWVRSEPVLQAPPMTLTMVQAMAGWFVDHGHHSAAVGVLLAFDVILRTGELTDLRTTDSTVGVKCLILVLRDTKIGARLGAHQEVSCRDACLVAKLRAQLQLLPRGSPLIGMSAKAFRALWRRALKDLGIPESYAPYCLRRGGATSLFRHTGSYDRVAEKGRWLSMQAMRGYRTWRRPTSWMPGRLCMQIALATCTSCRTKDGVAWQQTWIHVGQHWNSPRMHWFLWTMVLTCRVSLVFCVAKLSVQCVLVLRVGTVTQFLVEL